jgi:hypothetical protein
VTYFSFREVTGVVTLLVRENMHSQERKEEKREEIRKEKV